MATTSCPSCFASCVYEGNAKITCRECGREFRPGADDASKKVDDLPSLEELMANEPDPPPAPAEPEKNEPEESPAESADNGGFDFADFSQEASEQESVEEGSPTITPIPEREEPAEDRAGDEMFMADFGEAGGSDEKKEESPAADFGADLIMEDPGLPSPEAALDGDFGADFEEEHEKPVPPKASSGNDFSESKNAFNEIREFGESLADPSKKTKLEKAPPPPASGIGSRTLMVSGESIQGYKIQKYLSPISVMAPFDAKATDPLEKAFKLLSDRAAALGANAVLGIKWTMAPDGTHVVIMGSPVCCSPEK